MLSVLVLPLKHSLMYLGPTAADSLEEFKRYIDVLIMGKCSEHVRVTDFDRSDAIGVYHHMKCKDYVLPHTCCLD